MRVNNRKRIKRVYRVKSDAMINKIVSVVNGIPENEKMEFLDDYERDSIKHVSRWAKEASIPEILVILTKLNIPVTIQFVDNRNPFKSFELHKASKEFFRRGDLTKLKEAFQKHNYFCITGAEIMREQSFYSMLVGGTIFRQNPASKYVLKSAMKKDIKNQKVLDDFLESVYAYSEIGDLDNTDWKILYFIRKHENLPVGTLAIHDRVGMTVDAGIIQRHLIKLHRKGLVQKWGVKKNSTYALDSRGWMALTEAKKKFFSELRFFDEHGATPINQIEQQNGSSTEQKS